MPAAATFANDVSEVGFVSIFPQLLFEPDDHHSGYVLE
jgi:hypothetical protein